VKAQRVARRALLGFRRANEDVGERFESARERFDPASAVSVVVRK
jgi:hypothetical protein